MSNVGGPELSHTTTWGIMHPGHSKRYAPLVVDFTFAI